MLVARNLGQAVVIVIAEVLGIIQILPELVVGLLLADSDRITLFIPVLLPDSIVVVQRRRSVTCLAQIGGNFPVLLGVLVLILIDILVDALGHLHVPLVVETLRALSHAEVVLTDLLVGDDALVSLVLRHILTCRNGCPAHSSAEDGSSLPQRPWDSSSVGNLTLLGSYFAHLLGHWNVFPLMDVLVDVAAREHPLVVLATAAIMNSGILLPVILGAPWRYRVLRVGCHSSDPPFFSALEYGPSGKSSSAL